MGMMAMTRTWSARKPSPGDDATAGARLAAKTTFEAMEMNRRHDRYFVVATAVKATN